LPGEPQHYVAIPKGGQLQMTTINPTPVNSSLIVAPPAPQITLTPDYSGHTNQLCRVVICRDLAHPVWLAVTPWSYGTPTNTIALAGSGCIFARVEWCNSQVLPQ
jgi:hypothetical protein